MSVYCVYLEEIKLPVILLCSDLNCVAKFSCGVVDIKNYTVDVFIPCENLEVKWLFGLPSFIIWIDFIYTFLCSYREVGLTDIFLVEYLWDKRKVSVMAKVTSLGNTNVTTYIF